MSKLLLAVGWVSAALAYGCFSEHQAATAPVEGLCSFPVEEGVPGSTIVLINKFTFQPADLRVRAGDRVTWINCDQDPHTSTADAGEWASPLLGRGAAFTQAFPSVGEFSYHCDPHPFMTGRVSVE